MYIGPAGEHAYRSNIPPWEVLMEYLESHGMDQFAELIRRYLP